MFRGTVGQFGRLALVGLACVAAGYHLTETSHRQAERARQREQLARKARAASQDGQKEDSRPRQLVEWHAPDMLDRPSPRIADLNGSVRESPRGGTACWQDTGRTVNLSLLSAARSCVAATAHQGLMAPVYLSDRSPQGPPA